MATFISHIAFSFNKDNLRLVFLPLPSSYILCYIIIIRIVDDLKSDLFVNCDVEIVMDFIGILIHLVIFVVHGCNLSLDCFMMTIAFQ